MKKLFLFLLLTFSLHGREITPNDVYAQVGLIKEEVHFLLNYFDVKYDHDGIIKRTTITSKVKPRNVWQITYEIMVKINILREEYGLPTIEPANMVPVLHLNPDLVYEQTRRILTEFQIFKTRNGIYSPVFKEKTYKGKTPLDVFNSLSYVSKSLDELNKGIATSSYVFGEQMRIYDDITLIIEYLDIEDKTIPQKKMPGALPEDAFNKALNVLEKIKQIQISVGVDFVDFSEFKRGQETSSELYTLTQMIIAELQTIKAYLGIESVTRAASKYNTKTSEEVLQLISWNLRKLELINTLNIR